jgi:hypothetical protein
MERSVEPGFANVNVAKSELQGVSTKSAAIELTQIEAPLTCFFRQLVEINVPLLHGI